MWGPFRQTLIDGHLFYVEQARKRLLSQFEDIEQESDRAAEEWLEQQGDRFDPDRHDPGDFYEKANEVGIEFYQLLSNMRDQTRLSAAAGMFHEWDKQLRDWLTREILHWHHGDTITSKVWSVDFLKITDLIEGFGWEVRNTDYFKKLDACRLVVNVYKHGKGNSLDDLLQNYPEYIEDPLSGLSVGYSVKNYLDHTHLKLTNEQFQEFSDAIVAFWRGVPENIFNLATHNVPEWFDKAMQKDRAISAKGV